jgi:drug/metabolite transporter (DMT)-like permease
VLSLHTVWSIGVPIALVEEWTPRRTTPWLRTPGFVVGCALLALGCFGTTMSTYGNEHYVAAWPKLLAVAIIVVLLVVAAFAVPRRTAAPDPRPAPRPWVVLAATLAAGALFFLTKWSPVWVGVAAMVVALAGIATAITLWSRRSGWGRWHRLAAAAGALLTYAWHSFTTNPLMGGGPVVTPVSHVVFALAAVALLGFEVRALRRRAGAPAAEPVLTA